MSTMSPTGASVKVPFDSARSRRRGSLGSAEIKDDPVVRELMEEMGYTPANVRAALGWIQHRGSIDGCPIVDREDWPLIDVAALGPRPGAMVLTPSPATAYNPTLEETAWAAAAFAR